MPINYSKRKRSSNGDGNPVSKVPLLSPLQSRENILSPGRRVFTPPSPSAASQLWHRTPLGASNSGRTQSRPTTSLLNADSPKSWNKRLEHNQNAKQSFTPLVASPASKGGFVQVRNSQVVAQDHAKCACNGVGAVCYPCAGLQTLAAPRAGTPGFRPPEVLLKHMNQTTAVDMWSAGVVLLCVLSGRYPFFKSHCDLAALSEIINVFGTEAVEKIANKFGK